MTKNEKIYTGLVAALAGLLLLSIASLALLIIPELDEPDAIRVMQFSICCIGLEVIALLSTAGANISKQELRTIATVIQIAFLFLTGYGIPLAIWGIFLLRKRHHGTHNNEILLANNMK
jgi:hypothetical protein